MMKNVCLAITSTASRRISCRSLHQTSQETKIYPKIVSDNTNSLDQFQYFSMKIKDLMDNEQLEYFENVIRKVEDIDHPVADLMRTKLHNPMFDFILSLTTNMVNEGKPSSQKQQSLANSVQLIHIGNLVHQKGIFDLSKIPNCGNDLPENHDWILGNKIALLAGDFLLAHAQIKITQMRDAEVLRIISSAICDIINSYFFSEHDKNDEPLPLQPGKIPKAFTVDFEHSSNPIDAIGFSGTAEDEWMLRQTAHRGFLIAKGCQATAVLAKQPKSVQRNCFELGKYFHLTCQAFVDKESFKIGQPVDNFKTSLISAPVLFHFSHDRKLYKQVMDESNTMDGIDYANLYNKVISGPGVEATEKLMRKLKAKALSHLQSFSASEDRSKVEEILKEFE